MVKKTAVGYIRCSTPKQLKGYSLERQMIGCKEWALRNNVELMEIVVDVGTGYEGYHMKESSSGRKGNLGRWVKSLVNDFDIPDYFIFEYGDRVSRSFDATVELMNKLSDYDIQPVAVGIYDDIPYRPLTQEEKTLIYKA